MSSNEENKSFLIAEDLANDIYHRFDKIYMLVDIISTYSKAEDCFEVPEGYYQKLSQEVTELKEYLNSVRECASDDLKDMMTSLKEISDFLGKAPKTVLNTSSDEQKGPQELPKLAPKVEAPTQPQNAPEEPTEPPPAA